MPAEAVSAPSSLRRIARFLPSRRSLAIGAATAAVAAGAYVVALETSLFAIERIQVTGGSPAVDAQVAKALTALAGRSLVGLDGGDVLARTEALPTVISATYDRAFPSTLHVTIVPERPIAVLRAGPTAWVISARGRVMQPISTTGERTLPRIWKAEKDVRLGEVLPAKLGGRLAGTLAAVGPFRAQVATASVINGAIVFHLRSGLQVVLGAPYDIRLKVAVAAEILRQLPAGTHTIDVTAPTRAVTSP